MKTLHPKCPIDAHPLANELPLLDGERAAEFRKTIELDGRVHTPIVIIRKGADIGLNRKYEGEDAIIAGRNRVIQALESGIPWDDSKRLPRRDFDIKSDGPTVEQFVLREDVSGRRHLDANSRAIIAAKLAKSLIVESPKAEAAVANDGKEAPNSEDVKDDKPKERASHAARKTAAKTLQVSEDSVKKASLIEKYDDLAKAIQAKKISLDAAYTQACQRRDAEKSKKQANKLQDERKDAILYLKNTYGEKNLFVVDVIKKKVFGDERHGHRDLLLFNELTVAHQRALIPLLLDKKSLKEANEIFSAKEVDPNWSAEDLIHKAICNGLAKTEEKAFDIGEFKITISAKKDVCKRLEQLVSKV